MGASFKTQISKSFSPLNTQRWILHRNQEQNRFELIVKLEKVWHPCVSHSAIITPVTLNRVIRASPPNPCSEWEVIRQLS